MDNNQIKSNVLCASHWIRLVFMVLFSLVLQVAGSVMMLLVLVQFLFSLITGKANSALLELGSSLSKFIYQAFEFLTYNTDEKPFPFADWPKADVKEVAQEPAAAAEKPEHDALDPEKFETVEALEAEDSVKQEDA